MSIANIEELYKGLCEIAGFQAPALRPGEKGTLAFSVRLRGVIVSAMECTQGGAQSAILVAEFGSMPQERALAGWLALMDANLFLMDQDAPRFSRDPKTGEVILQWTCALWDLSATDAYIRVRKMVDLALLWRQDHFLGSRDTFATSGNPGRPANQAADGDVANQSAANFRLFHRHVCEALGQPLPPAPQDGDVADCTFPIRMDALGLDVSVGHSPCIRPGIAFVKVRFGTPALESALERATTLMEANFTLMMERHSATFCRDPWTGELVLLYMLPLAGADAQHLLTQIASVAELAHHWMLVPFDSGIKGAQPFPLADSAPTV